MESGLIAFTLTTFILADLWTISQQSSDNLILKSVAIVHRHGDRTPISTFPTDSYANASFWLDGPGELTSAGKARMFALGQYFRERYGDFWPLNVREVEVRSSDVNRCLESSALVLAGAFPPSGRWIWSNKLHWQPFPIHTAPRTYDNINNPSAACPVCEKEEERLKKSPEYKQHEVEFHDLFHYLTKYTGMNITDLFSAQRIHDTLKIQAENNYTLPSWATTDVMNRLKRISDLTFTLDYSTYLIQRLRGGEFLKDLKSHFTTIMKQSLKSQDESIPIVDDVSKKIFFYSTHDSQLSITLSTLKVFDKLSPPYGSSIIFELYQEKSTNHFKLSLLYLNDTYSKQPHYLNLPECDDTKFCDIEQFYHQIFVYLPENWRSECGLEGIHCEEDLVTLSLNLLTFIVISVLVSLTLIYFAIKKKGKDAYVYQMLPVL
ncbi:prostatic acid phosphatase-like [Panonychus citri]|uniref:prostatic acid phosphatase-like n=1 Tax=Panonychus citri TaxID=50023 RepID=UPI002308248F|nr:prostatic acid phosphatase-like [Panonychus citri]